MGSCSPSSNRTCRFPASGSPTRVVTQHTRGVDGVPSERATAVGASLRCATQFPARQGDADWQRSVRPTALGFPVRPGAIAQAAAPFLARNVREVRPRRSTGMTPLPRYDEPVRLPAAAAPGGMASHAALRGSPRTTPGRPGPSLALSTRALPTHPGPPDACVRSLLPHQWQASSPSEDGPRPLVSRGRIGFASAGLASSLSSLGSDSPGCHRPAGPARFARLVTRPRRAGATG